MKKYVTVNALASASLRGEKMPAYFEEIMEKRAAELRREKQQIAEEMNAAHYAAIQRHRTW